VASVLKEEKGWHLWYFVIHESIHIIVHLQMIALLCNHDQLVLCSTIEPLFHCGAGKPYCASSLCLVWPVSPPPARS
jgi:hypothetical protein